jgi:hypothetical protein
MLQLDASCEHLRDLGAWASTTYKGCDAQLTLEYVKKLRHEIHRWKAGEIKNVSKEYLEEFDSSLAPPYDPCPAYRMLRAEIQKTLGLYVATGSSVQPLDVVRDHLLCQQTDGSKRYLQQNQPEQKHIAFKEYLRSQKQLATYHSKIK